MYSGMAFQILWSGLVTTPHSSLRALGCILLASHEFMYVQFPQMVSNLNFFWKKGASFCQSLSWGSGAWRPTLWRQITIDNNSLSFMHFLQWAITFMATDCVSYKNCSTFQQQLLEFSSSCGNKMLIYKGLVLTLPFHLSLGQVAFFWKLVDISYKLWDSF